MIRLLNGERVQLTNGNSAYEISYPTEQDKDRFSEWIESIGIDQYVRLDTYYTAELFGDIDHDAIFVADHAPDAVHTLCLLKFKTAK